MQMVHLPERKEVASFPTFEGEKGVDALRQTIIAIHANKDRVMHPLNCDLKFQVPEKKIYRQKGLRSWKNGRQKSNSTPWWRCNFGPRPRSYNQKLNKKIKRLALGRALYDQANASGICLISEWEISEPKTKLFNTLIKSIAPDSKKILIVSEKIPAEIELAAVTLQIQNYLHLII